MRYLLLVIFFNLLSCQSHLERIRNIGAPPSMSSVEVPIELLQDQDDNKYYENNNNSLWRPGSKSSFRANKLWSVGDIIKVEIDINDSAKVNNNTQQTRTSNFNNNVVTTANNNSILPEIIGKYAKGVVEFNNLITPSSRYNHRGSGAIDRKENVTAQIAVNVIKILPNNNLVIFGHQEVRINYELREIKVSGIIRPGDISLNNSINLNQISQARVSYGGKGVVSEVQNAKLGIQILDIVKPF